MIDRGAMSLKNLLFYFAVMATLITSFKLCDGQDSDAVGQRPELIRGSLRIEGMASGGKRDSAAPTRFGSLAFTSQQQGDLNSTHVRHDAMHAKLKRMDPSVQCGDDLMTLKVKRGAASHVLVDNGEGPLTPLSRMSSECGFSVKRSRRDVQFDASYQGCHVAQQDGDYVLPLRLWGAPMTMSCPAALSVPPVFCFPSEMVVKIDGIAANQLKVKVSGAWMPLSSACSSCGLNVEVFSGGLTLTAPYHGGSCIAVKDEEYLLSLLLANVELSVACPSVPDKKLITATTAPPSDSGHVLQHPQYPLLPIFPQNVMVTPGPATGTVAPLPRPQLPSVPAAQHPAYPFMPHFPQYLWFPRPEPPTQSPVTKNTAPPPAQLPQMPQYPYSPFPQFPMVPGIFHPTTPPPPPPPPATPAPTTKHERKPQAAQQPQFPVPYQYSFLPFPKNPPSPKDQTQAKGPKPVIQRPNMYPQFYQFPVLYPPPTYPPQRLNTPCTCHNLSNQ